MLFGNNLRKTENGDYRADETDLRINLDIEIEHVCSGSKLFMTAVFGFLLIVDADSGSLVPGVRVLMHPGKL